MSKSDNVGVLDKAAFYLIGLLLGIAIVYAMFIPIAYLLLWAANTAFGTHLPVTFRSAFGGATLIMGFNFLFRRKRK